MADRAVATARRLTDHPLPLALGRMDSKTFAGTGSRMAREGVVTAGPPQPDDFANLYRRAFAAYGTHALWNKRALENPTKDDALVIARALRIEGDREARRLAEQIEQACRGAL